MDTANDHRGRGLAAIAASAFLWSLAGVFIKLIPWSPTLIAFVFVLIGMGVFFLDGWGGGSLPGNIAAALSGLTFGLYFVFMRMQKDGSAMESMLPSPPPYRRAGPPPSKAFIRRLSRTLSPTRIGLAEWTRRRPSIMRGKFGWPLLGAPGRRPNPHRQIPGRR